MLQLYYSSKFFVNITTGHDSAPSELKYHTSGIIMNTIYTKYTDRKFKTCGLSLDDILVRVFADASDIKDLIDDDSITVDLDDKVLSFCNEMIGMHPDEKTNKMNSVTAGITELFLIGEKELTGINTESIKLMVYDYHNPSHLGEQLYNSLIEALDGVTSYHSITKYPFRKIHSEHLLHNM